MVQSLRSQFGNDDADSDILAAIHLKAILWHVDVCYLESVHSALLRIIQSKSLHTHRALFSDVCAERVCQSIRRREAERKLAQAHSSTSSGARKRKQAVLLEQEREQRGRRKHRKRGSGLLQKKIVTKSGGARRAFVRHLFNGLSKQGRPNFKIVNDMWRSLPAKSKQFFETWGVAATQVGRCRSSGSCTKSSFGVTERVARMRAGKRFAAATSAVLQKAHTAYHLIEIAADCSKPDGGGIEKAIVLARSAKRARSSNHRTQRVSLDQCSASFSAGVGQDHLAWLKGVMPSLPTEQMRSVPAGSVHGGPPMRVYECVPDSKPISMTLAWLAQHASSTNVGGMFDSVWKHMCSVVEHASVPPLQKGATPLRGKCCVHGICHCRDGGGYGNFRCFNAFLAMIKRVFHRSNCYRFAKLVDGFVVLRVTVEARERPYGPKLPDQVCLERWCHIGKCSLSPYDLTLQEVVPRGDIDSTRLFVEVPEPVKDFCLFAQSVHFAHQLPEFHAFCKRLRIHMASRRHH